MRNGRASAVRSPAILLSLLFGLVVVAGYMLTTGDRMDSGGAPAVAGVGTEEGVPPEAERLQPLTTEDADARTRDLAVPHPSQPLAVGARLTGRFGPTVPSEGRTVTLRPILRRRGAVTTGEIVFVAGPERGRRLSVAATVTPEPVALMPGFAILEVREGEGGVCRREVLLDHLREVTLDLDFDDRGLLQGFVVDEEGAPVADALVNFDGVEMTTDPRGFFAGQVTASGEPLLVVSAPGYAPYREELPEALPEGTSPKTITLSRGTSLTIQVTDVAGARGAGPVALYLMPTGAPLSTAGGRLQSLYPWERVNPVSVPLGGSVRLDGLPPCKLEVFAFQGRALAGPVSAFLSAAGEDVSLTVSMHSLGSLTGRVLIDGEPVPGAAVSLRYANPIRATHRLLGEHAEYTRQQPIEVLPVVAQDVATDVAGRFAFGLDERIGKPPYVTVLTADGKTSITRRVDDTSAELVFELSEPRGPRTTVLRGADL